MRKPKRNYRLVVPGAALILFYLVPITLWGAQPGGIYPTVVYGKYKKEKLPVFAVDGTSPVSQYEEKQVKLSAGTTTVERSDYYNPGFIEVLGTEFDGGSSGSSDLGAGGDFGNFASSTTQGAGLQGGVRSESRGYYAIRIKSRESVEDLYMAVVCAPRSDIEDDILSNKSLTVSFKELDPLPANTEMEIEVIVNFISSSDEGGDEEAYMVLPLFYSCGYEIQNSRSAQIYEYFRKKEEVYHQTLLDEYLKNNAGKNMKQTPVIRFLPYVPPAVFEAQRGIDTAVVLTIDDTGMVEKVEFQKGLKSATMEYLEKGLKDWLFLPPLKNGEPKPLQVKVPLKY